MSKTKWPFFKVPVASDEPGRRSFLARGGLGLGGLALSYLLQRDGALAATSSDNPLAPKLPPLPRKAKSCILLFMRGGPSHIDTFDPKPALLKYSGKPSNASGERVYIHSPFRFDKHGKCGTEISELFPHLGTCVDDMAVLRGMYTDSDAHSAGEFLMHTGFPLPGNPAMGAWMVYGLGSENQNLPAFVVLPSEGGDLPQYWSNGYLSSIYQGTVIQPVGSPIPDLEPPAGVTPERQQANLALRTQLDQPLLDSNPILRSDLMARLRNYELAFRMQSAVPEALDLAKEPEAIRKLYGLDHKVTASMGRKCLMARRLVQRGVPFIEIFHSRGVMENWDTHADAEVLLRNNAEETDRPIAALLKDLKQQGLLASTLVVWGGEFGRTSDTTRNIYSTIPGRDHNKDAMALWMAGGGVKGGMALGATDELGSKAVENRYHVRDLHATALRLMGLNDMELTYYHNGRYKRLTDLGGKLIKEVIA